MELEAFGDLSQEQQDAVSQMPAMHYLNKTIMIGGALKLQGDKELICQVKCPINLLEPHNNDMTRVSCSWGELLVRLSVHLW